MSILYCEGCCRVVVAVVVVVVVVVVDVVVCISLLQLPTICNEMQQQISPTNVDVVGKRNRREE